MSIDYVALGKITGEMAIEIMRGADAATMAVRKLSEAQPVVNEAALRALNIAIPEAYASAQRVGS